jgi:hypothetical protein
MKKWACLNDTGPYNGNAINAELAAVFIAAALECQS